MQRIARTAARIVVVGAVVASAATTALAHGDEERGALTLSIGFGAEPAYVGQPNSVQILISRDGEPVAEVGGGLEVEVSFGDASTTLPLEPTGTPGDYRAWFVPSEPGRYTFSFAGVLDGEEVEVSMTSGPDTFSEVIDPAEAAFPPAASGPTAADLAERIERESATDGRRRRGGGGGAWPPRTRPPPHVRSRIVGALLGLVALIVGVLALITSRRAT